MTISAKEADFKFKEMYGADFKDNGIKVDYSDFIPDSIAKTFNALRDINDFGISEKIVYDKSFVLSEINDLISSYELIKSNCPYANISRDMSSLIIGCSHIFDNEMCNFVTSDVGYGSKKPLSSKLTSVVHDALQIIDNTEKLEVNDNSVDEALTSLINTVIEYFDPIVVARVLYSIINKNRAHVFFTKERIKGYYEALINRENVIYSGKYIPIAESVGYTYFDLTYTNPMDILTDAHGVYSLIKMGTNVVYGDIFKQTITDELLKAILGNASGKKDSQTILVLKYLKDEVVSWIKHKNLDERPECPKSFEYIDIKHFLSNLYMSGIHILGDSEKIISKFDNEYEDLDIKIYNGKFKDEELEKAKNRLAAIKERKTEYIRLKSHISFLFMEIMTNEKMIYKVFDETLAASIILTEPPFDFGMNDICMNVASMFVKNDYAPMDTTPINPQYIHYGDGDISTPNAFYLASVIASLIHPNMRSVSAVASIYNFETLEVAMKSLNFNCVKAHDIYNKVVESYEVRIKGVCKQYESDIPEEVSKLVESGVDLDVAKNLSNIIKDHKVDPKYNMVISLISPTVDEILDMKKWIDGYDESFKNIFKLMEEIKCNINCDKCIHTGRSMREEQKPPRDFWPIYQSYYYPIVDKFSGANDTNTATYTRGDIINERYKTRYKVTNPDK